ncbi:MAG: hypothetical protein H6713_02725 [Myxococcales bacterium]|nr:hypothetical protein [Myxococcales bacterium]
MPLALACGCAATRHVDTQPAGAGPNKMLDSVAVGKSRCEDPGKANFAPFVVEWDATDLSTFEAKAARDLVFVRYEDCAIELMYSCADNGIPGAYGRYEPPTFTSGAVESFEMKNEDELYAKLPLGALSLAGNVQIGETLELRYYVSGAVNSTRSYVARSAIADNRRCEGATHFVSAYNLGAFALEAYKNRAAGVEAGSALAGGGARTKSESENVKQGGSLADCETQSQRRCRVPIRLVLQRIDDAGEPGDEQTPSAPSAEQAIAAVESSPQHRALKLRLSARKKELEGDGPGCLDDLTRADSLHPQGRASYLETQAFCTMRAGDCDGGRALLREHLASRDVQRHMTDEQLDHKVGEAASARCPLDALARPADKIERLQALVREGRNRDRPTVCVDAATRGAALAESTPNDGQTRRLHSDARLVVKRAAQCLVALGRCDEARSWWLRHEQLRFAGSKRDRDEIDAQANAEFDRVNNRSCGS